MSAAGLGASPPAGETPGLPHMGSPVCSVLLLSMFCALMPKNLLEKSERHRCCMRRDRVRKNWNRTKQFTGISTAVDRMAASTVVPDLLPLYTTS